MALGLQPRYYCTNVSGGCVHAVADRVFSAAESARTAGRCAVPGSAGCGQALKAGEPVDLRARWAAIGVACVLAFAAAGWGVQRVWFPPLLEGVDFAAQRTEVTDTAGSVAIEIVRRDGTNAASVVDYAALDGSAKAGQDFAAAQGQLAFAAGENRKSISVLLLPDATFQKGRRFFSLTLLNVRAAPKHVVYIEQQPVARSDALAAEQSVMAASRTAKDIADFVVRQETLDKLLDYSRDKAEEFRQYQQSLATVNGNLSRARESYMQMLRDLKALQPAVVLGAMDREAADLARKGFDQQSQALLVMKRHYGELLASGSTDMDRWARELSQVIPRVGANRAKQQT